MFLNRVAECIILELDLLAIPWVSTVDQQWKNGLFFNAVYLWLFLRLMKIKAYVVNIFQYILQSQYISEMDCCRPGHFS